MTTQTLTQPLEQHVHLRVPVAQRQGVRLTRRGRAVVLLVLVTLLLAAFSLGRVGSQAAPKQSGAQGEPARAELGHAVVHPGESLWAVAKRVAPGHDPRAVVDQIAELNHLDSGAVQAGQLLLVPAR